MPPRYNSSYYTSFYNITTPDPLRLSDRIRLRFPDGRNEIREEFLNSMNLGLRARRLPKDVLENIWRFWLRNRSIPFFPLYYNRRS
jgi:hypothetical protein